MLLPTSEVTMIPLWHVPCNGKSVTRAHTNIKQLNCSCQC